MKRRDFLKYTVPTALGIPSIINGYQLKAMPNSLWSAISPNFNTDRVLVIIQMFGGNDGLNMVLPIDQYGNLANARSNIIMPLNNILALSGNATTGLHPSMTGMRDLYNNAKLSIIQAVGYENPSFSHFRASDIWTSGSNAATVLTNGWGGRYLEDDYTGYPVGYPNANMPDPLAIQIGSQISGLFLGARGNTAFPVENTDYFYSLVNGIPTPTPNTFAGDELAYIRYVAQTTNQYTQRILSASNTITTQYGGYPDNRLADQLKIVARLIAGGMKSRVYMVGMDGFDTHSNQVGDHANLLDELSSGISAFMADLAFLNVDHRVLGLTFSEFGRRILSNQSAGTDHGAAAPMFLFGKNVKAGVMGVSPTIPAVTTEDDNVAMQFDFRQVYGGILKNWFCATDAAVTAVFEPGIVPLSVVTPAAVGVCATALAVKKIKIIGEANKNATNRLTWTITQEDEISKFEVYRSNNLAKFEKIGQISQKETLGENSYQFIDSEPFAGFTYYKVKAIGLDETESYSNVVALKQDSEFVNIYPNPAINVLNVDIAFKRSLNAEISLINMEGQIVHTQKATTGTNADGKIRIEISSLPKGMYITNVVLNNELKKSEKIIITR